MRWVQSNSVRLRSYKTSFCSSFSIGGGKTLTLILQFRIVFIYSVLWVSLLLKIKLCCRFAFCPDSHRALSQQGKVFVLDEKASLGGQRDQTLDPHPLVCFVSADQDSLHNNNY